MNPKIGRSVGRFGLFIRKNLPTITAMASIFGVVGTGVLSARAAYKSVPSIEKHKENIEKVRSNKDNLENKEYNKAVVTVYKDTAKDLVKVYWPAAITMGLTVAGIFTTNTVHRKRYLTMAGMYTAAISAYKDYRDRVRAKYGEEVERDLYYNIEREEIITVETDKRGKEKTKVEVVMKPKSGLDETLSLLLFEPSKGNHYWYHGRPDMTYYYLHGREEILTQMLRTRGYLFLNEVLRELCQPEIPEGQMVGWIYDETKGDTDNCVDFGLKEGTENFDLFMSGKNDFVYLQLNHDGTIYDKFPFYDRVWKRNHARHV